MSILETIRSSLRSLLGGGGKSDSTPSEPSHTEGQVSVEHEPQEDREAADASTESTIKGTDTATADESEADAEEGAEADAVAEAEEGAEPEADAVAAETDAAASTGTLVDEEAGKEPAEVVSSPGTDDEGAVDADEPDTDDTAETAATPEDEAATEAAGEAAVETPGEPGEPKDEEADEADGEPVETLKGIGPAYGERLGNAGIETVADLAAADAADLAAEIDVSEKRVTGWIDRAQEES
jgi:predicted flap endonuclease-1-like 5' DNA nuclease